MAFGQQAGPPASRREVQELLTLLQDAGHSDFRDARGPMGFTQRPSEGGGSVGGLGPGSMISSRPSTAADSTTAPPSAVRLRILSLVS
jgi:hypothetical protein